MPEWSCKYSRVEVLFEWGLEVIEEIPKSESRGIPYGQKKRPPDINIRGHPSPLN